MEEPVQSSLEGRGEQCQQTVPGSTTSCGAVLLFPPAQWTLRTLGGPPLPGPRSGGAKTSPWRAGALATSSLPVLSTLSIEVSNFTGRVSFCLDTLADTVMSPPRNLTDWLLTRDSGCPMKRQLWVGVMTHVVNQSKKSCLLYCPAFSPLGTVVTKRLNAGLTCSLMFASWTRTFFTPRVFCYALWWRLWQFG